MPEHVAPHTCGCHVVTNKQHFRWDSTFSANTNKCCQNHIAVTVIVVGVSVGAVIACDPYLLLLQLPYFVHFTERCGYFWWWGLGELVAAGALSERAVRFYGFLSFCEILLINSIDNQQ